MATKVKVVCGANEQVLELEEPVNIGQLRERLSSVMNIPTPSQAILGGQNVNDDYVPEDGAQVEFVKPAGTKG